VIAGTVGIGGAGRGNATNPWGRILEHAIAARRSAPADIPDRAGPAPGARRAGGSTGRSFDNTK